MLPWVPQTVRRPVWAAYYYYYNYYYSEKNPTVEIPVIRQPEPQPQQYPDTMIKPYENSTAVLRVQQYSLALNKTLQQSLQILLRQEAPGSNYDIIFQLSRFEHGYTSFE